MVPAARRPSTPRCSSTPARLSLPSKAAVAAAESFASRAPTILGRLSVPNGPARGGHFRIVNAEDGLVVVCASKTRDA
jgi:hypothetical protein